MQKVAPELHVPHDVRQRCMNGFPANIESLMQLFPSQELAVLKCATHDPGVISKQAIENVHNHKPRCSWRKCSEPPSVFGARWDERRSETVLPEPIFMAVAAYPLCRVRPRSSPP
jgi:hypothetical protein